MNSLLPVPASQLPRVEVVDVPRPVEERDPLVLGEEEEVEAQPKDGHRAEEEEVDVDEHGQGLQPPGHGDAQRRELNPHQVEGLRALVGLLGRLHFPGTHAEDGFKWKEFILPPKLARNYIFRCFHAPAQNAGELTFRLCTLFSRP